MTRLELIQKLGLENSDPLTQDQLLQTVADAVSTRILNKLTEQLSDEDLDEMSRLIDNGDESAVTAYVESKIPNYEAFKAQIEEETINEIANNADGLVEQVKITSTENVVE